MSNSRLLRKLSVIILLCACAALAIAAPMASASSRGAAAAGGIALDTPHLSFRVSPESGAFEIDDKSGGVVWKSDFRQSRFGEATIDVSGHQQHLDLAQCQVERTGDGLDLTFHPLASQPQAQIVVSVRPAAEGDGLRFTYAASPNLKLESIRLLDQALWTTDAERGYVIIPARMGLMIPARHGVNFTHTFDTYAYEGCHMAMAGVVKNGAAALITWDDPYVAVELKSESPATGELAGKQVLAPSLVLHNSARWVEVRFLGRGDYVTLAKAYRQIAAERGWLNTWSEKLQGHPERAKLFGAINYKLWALLDREMDPTSTHEKVLKVNWTFDEAAQVAEHLKSDLKLDKVLFIMGGWTRRGYDNQHPDILPANPECGGNSGLSECARRVRQLGYLFGLHDNYQDIYRDSPSWSEDLIMKHPDGSLVKGGSWWGGQAYLTCSLKALDLAKRPQNLPAVKALTNADSYFIDTTYASGLQECFDPAHPLTRADDMKWKQALSDYARQEFGIFGSEDGREWAIPHSDFFEGLTGVNGTWYHDKNLLKETGGVSVPLFELVYRDCIALYGKYGFDISQSTDYVLYHLSIGRTLNYHEIPPHLYWKEPRPWQAHVEKPKTGEEDPALFTRADHGWAEGLHPMDRFVKNTYEILSPLNELTAEMQMTRHQFLTPDFKVQRSIFGEGANQVEVVVNTGAANYSVESRLGGKIVLPPGGFLIEAPTFVAFHALNWNGLAYPNAPLFTMRSADGQPLARSRRIRVFHGFGDPRVRLAGGTHIIAKEEVVSVTPHAAESREGAPARFSCKARSGYGFAGPIAPVLWFTTEKSRDDSRALPLPLSCFQICGFPPEVLLARCVRRIAK